MAIANRMQHDGKAISLLARQQGLGMPLVEVWSGLLLTQN
ncbi:MAG: hypothetical protein CLLPBCKN_006815 [Chroococcidiopsis cubana SAG 39.79]|nr:hypothetical protein [Chroococcidiopsis cubana SAG 39.79]